MKKNAYINTHIMQTLNLYSYSSIIELVHWWYYASQNSELVRKVNLLYKQNNRPCYLKFQKKNQNIVY
jgi:hypothetical protein